MSCEDCIGGWRYAHGSDDKIRCLNCNREGDVQIEVLEPRELAPEELRGIITTRAMTYEEALALYVRGEHER